MLASFRRELKNRSARMRTAHRLRQHRLRYLYQNLKEKYEVLTRQQKITFAIAAVSGLPLYLLLDFFQGYLERFTPQLAHWIYMHCGVQFTSVNLFHIVDIAAFSFLLLLSLCLGLLSNWLGQRLGRGENQL